MYKEIAQLQERYKWNVQKPQRVKTAEKLKREKKSRSKEK